MAPKNTASDLESERSVQGTTTRKSSFLSYATRGDYTLEPLAYGIHHRSVRLVEIVEDTLDKYVGKGRTHGAGLINL